MRGKLRRGAEPGSTRGMAAQEIPALLIPRPAAQGRAFAAALARAAPGRWRPVLAPVMEIRPHPDAVPAAGPDDLLVFTSANAVAAWAAAGRGGARAVCVGAATAAAARAAGLAAEALGPDAEALAAALAARTPQAGRVLHLRGAHAAADLAARLRAAGHRAEAHVVYDQAPVPLPAGVAADLAAGRIAALALFSPRSAGLLGAAVAPARIAPGTLAYCLSPAVAAAAARLDLPVRTAGVPEAAAMIALLAGPDAADHTVAGPTGL